MQIKKIELAYSVYTPAQYTSGDLPEIAVSGRSNAGKSSLINALCNRGIARVSQQPGKTRSINAYRINDAFLLMDLPGYGYARRSTEEKNAWRSLMEGYFEKSTSLLHLLLLCDIRHDASEGDLMMADWLRHFGVKYTLVATKADKIAKSKRINYVRSLSAQLQAPASLTFSASEGNAKLLLLNRLDEILASDI
jgi:GTP-binding protein